MAYDLVLSERVRDALAQTPRVEEKKMFGGLAFMVDDKMCVTVSRDRLMCRIDPALHEQVLARKGTQRVIMNQREYTGYVYVGEEGWRDPADFDYWIGLALDYNKHAKASSKKKR